MESLSLYELNNLVRRTLELTMCDEYWIHAEISELRINRHCYIEFAQKEPNGNGLIAKARGQIWANKWMILSQYFQQTTGQTLSPGMKVLVKVQVTFHELYGYSLNVVDIDPTYTLGDIAHKRKEILEQLKAEGVDNMNKELQLPRLLQRIAVISAEGAAGYGDFCNQLENNKRKLAFFTKLFPAVMQGKDVEPTIIAALDKIASNLNRWDAVVIIRGGGATSDLSGFDTLELAENVAQFPLPIITGIGHERDFTVLDMIAHTRVKTPTAAAEFLIHHQEEELDYVEELAEKITQTTSNILFNEKKRLQLATNKLPSLFTNLKLREEAKMERLMAYMHNRMTQQIMKDKSHTELLEQQLTLLSRSLLDKEKNKLEVFENKIKNAAPERILQLGFTITRTNGKVVKDASSIKKGDVLDTTFANGTIKSIAE